MKSNVLKSSIAAFAFTLAIVASFAFSNVEAAAPVDAALRTGIPTSPCEFISSITDCEPNGSVLCTSGFDPVYELQQTTNAISCNGSQLLKP